MRRECDQELSSEEIMQEKAETKMKITKEKFKHMEDKMRRSNKCLFNHNSTRRQWKDHEKYNRQESADIGRTKKCQIKGKKSTSEHKVK